MCLLAGFCLLFGTCWSMWVLVGFSLFFTCADLFVCRPTVRKRCSSQQAVRQQRNTIARLVLGLLLHMKIAAGCFVDELHLPIPSPGMSQALRSTVVQRNSSSSSLVCPRKRYAAALAAIVYRTARLYRKRWLSQSSCEFEHMVRTKKNAPSHILKPTNT